MATQLSIIDSNNNTQNVSICLGETVGYNDAIPKGCVWIEEKNHPEIAKALEDANLITPWKRNGVDPYTSTSQYGSCTLYKIDLDEMAKYDPEGTKIYNASYDTGYKIFQIENMLPEEYNEMNRNEIESRMFWSDEEDIGFGVNPDGSKQYEDPRAPENIEWDLAHKKFGGDPQFY